ncbi:tRNA-splicing endonuclease subunit Sen15 [Eucyclogobius newberryi]|uniref:tRNA-splicing endonuclease subunit Sen15 n=1 Tax=Eucyclogobius newberryi TaxID=166745 RepID=UPI003B5ADD24
MTESSPADNWILLHPVFREMKSLGVEDSAQTHAAFLVYMDLTEVRHWKEVSCLKSTELQVILLEAREKEGGPVHTVLPLLVRQSITHKSLRCVLDRGFPMLLCVVASDSTLVYQKISDGLVTPEPPVGAFQDLGRRQHRKRRHHPQ